MLRRFFISALIATPLAACVSQEAAQTNSPTQGAEFVGRWVEILLGGDGGGFELFADGTAASINDPELAYSAWRSTSDKLILTVAKAAGSPAEVTYMAQFNDVGGLRLTAPNSDWPRIFRKID